jgi:hypothetical protein
MASETTVRQLAPGARVQVRCRFDGRWASGFVASTISDSEQPDIRVKRLSDGSVLPYVFHIDDVRPEPPTR